MKTLNDVQVKQLEELGEVVSEEFAKLMLEYTRLVTSEQLDSMCDEAIELEESVDDYVYSVFDMNYYCVASDYGVLDSNTIKQSFSFYGDYNLYMDELGRGLVVGYY